MLSLAPVPGQCTKQVVACGIFSQIHLVAGLPVRGVTDHVLDCTGQAQLGVHVGGDVGVAGGADENSSFARLCSGPRLVTYSACVLGLRQPAGQNLWP